MSFNKIKGSFGDYDVSMTDDGSQTLYSQIYQESCHSKSGAYQETVYNYVSGTDLLPKISKKDEVSVLEIGFATGLGLKATLLEITKHLSSHHFEGPPKKLFFLSTEIDELLSIHYLKKLQEEKLIEKFELKELGNNKVAFAPILLKNPDGDQILLIGELRLLIGNARETILEIQKTELIRKIDCFYHDPFSPKKNPILWTTEFFKVLYDISSKDAALSTYSSTKAVWKAMINAGWRVQEVGGFGNKRLSTRAYTQRDSSPWVLEQCEKSPLEALSDSSLPKGLDPFL